MTRDTLTLDDAIQHAEHRGRGEGPCAADHRQLAAWLRELRALREACDGEGALVQLRALRALLGGER